MSLVLKPGVTLRDKWRLDKFLGRGGMSTVFAATHRNGMRGAIKVLHHELTTNDVVKKRFLREGYVANKVGHPGAVKVLDDDQTDDGLVFLVMELLEGETLKQRWIASDRRLEVRRALEIVASVLDVLESAHESGIVHRDLKPDNIFLMSSGPTKVLDFGIARILEAALPNAADATSSAAMMGTPAFMPPEQALAHWHKVDGRSDLFAIAATVFTVLSGRLVHTGSTLPELLINAATQQAQPIREVMPELDPAVAEVIDKALAFDIADRWPDARSMRLALLQAQARKASKTMPLDASKILALAPRVQAQAQAADEHITAVAATNRSTDLIPAPPEAVPDQPTALLPRAVPAGADATPVRLQQPLRPENVVRLASAVTSPPTPPKRRTAFLVVAAVVSVAAALVAWTATRGTSKPPRKASTAAATTNTAAAPPLANVTTQSSPTVVPEVTPSVAAPAASAALSTAAPPSASSSSPPPAGPAVTRPNNRTPPVVRPPRTVKCDEFSGRCR